MERGLRRKMNLYEEKCNVDNRTLNDIIKDEKIVEDTQNLKMYFQEQITKDDNKRLDELHLGFYQAYPEISDMHDINLVKRVFDYIKRCN